MTAIVTYNDFFNFEKGIIKIAGEDVLILPYTFNPKGPENVLRTDPNWMMLMDHKASLEKTFMFTGKKPSGALEMIDLACEDLDKNKLFLILCDHDLKEKEARLKKHGIPKTSYVCFKDGHLPCQESPQLLGYLYTYLFSLHGSRIFR